MYRYGCKAERTPPPLEPLILLMNCLTFYAEEAGIDLLLLRFFVLCAFVVIIISIVVVVINFRKMNNK